MVLYNDGIITSTALTSVERSMKSVDLIENKERIIYTDNWYRSLY